MDAQKADLFIISNGKYFEGGKILEIKERLLALDDSRWGAIQTIQFKDPTIALIISLMAGIFGADRFFIGDTFLGILKLITLGGVAIWTIVDWFMIMDATREKNTQMILEAMQ